MVTSLIISVLGILSSRSSSVFRFFLFAQIFGVLAWAERLSMVANGSRFLFFLLSLDRSWSKMPQRCRSDHSSHRLGLCPRHYLPGGPEFDKLHFSHALVGSF